MATLDMTVECRNLTCDLDNGRRVLDDISVTFTSGTLGLVAGATGSGKSMLLRCVNGLIPRRYNGHIQGRVIVCGRDVQDLTPLEISDRVGSVLQEPSRQMVAVSVADELAFALENRGVSCAQIRETVAMTAAAIDIESLLTRKTSTLSGGEAQKVAIAAALVSDPKVVLLDEPLASLDSASARKIVALLRSLASNGKTVICAEHRVRLLVEGGADMCIVLHNGKPRYTGSPAGIENTSAPIRRAYSTATSRDTPCLELKNVSHARVDGTLALDAIDLTVFPGDVIAVVGRNGSGKTTLCRHMIGLSKPTTGSIKVVGENASKLSIAQLSRFVGYICQAPSSMLFASSIKEEIGFGLEMRNVPDCNAQRSVQQIAELFQFSQRLGASPFSLSLGERALLCAAAVAVTTPSMFVLDEPTSALDSVTAHELFCRLRAVAPVLTLVFATHDLDIVNAYATRCVVMDHGRLVAEIDPSTLYTNETLRYYEIS